LEFSISKIIKEENKEIAVYKTEHHHLQAKAMVAFGVTY
jgi:hypothetical protein